MLELVAEGVLTHQSAVLQNNSIVVQSNAGVLLIDAGITCAEMSCLARDLRELGETVVVGFSTHPDWDHVLWHDDLGDAPRYSTARCATLMQELRSSADWKDRVAEGLPPEIAEDVPLDLFGLIAGLPDEAKYIPWDGPNARIIEHTAHAQGHAALLIKERKVLVAGDMLSDLFVPMLDFSALDPIEEYLTALRLLEDAVNDADVVIPGHGSVGGAGQQRTRIELDRAYVHALRDRLTPDDPRISSPKEGLGMGGRHPCRTSPASRRKATRLVRASAAACRSAPADRRRDKHDRAVLVLKAERQHFGAQRADLARREVDHRHHLPPDERLGLVVHGDLRRGFLDPDLRPEIDQRG